MSLTTFANRPSKVESYKETKEVFSEADPTGQLFHTVIKSIVEVVCKDHSSYDCPRSAPPSEDGDCVHQEEHEEAREHKEHL